ncbi:MAG: hypothetical protein QME74_04965, partial [Candidatus Edwardsbacteria bacterium]|nr:hypothetical protein [Candidatus Edwardsbacteria bacterium]
LCPWTNPLRLASHCLNHIIGHFILAYRIGDMVIFFICRRESPDVLGRIKREALRRKSQSFFEALRKQRDTLGAKRKVRNDALRILFNLHNQ